LKDIGNVAKFQSVMEQLNPSTHSFTGSTLIFATQVYSAMVDRIVPDTTAGAAPGALMVNTN
jgi:mannitol-1-phosphate/altronate dehydrogenase